MFCHLAHSIATVCTGLCHIASPAVGPLRIHKQWQHKNTHAHTLTPGALLYSWVCHVAFDSEALCHCWAASAKSLHTMCNSRDMHTHTHTHTELAMFYRAAHHPRDKWDVRGMRVLGEQRRGGGGNWQANFTVIGQAISLIIDYSSRLKAHNLITYTKMQQSVGH